MSESSVPVPRPSEPPPTTTQEECDAKVAAAHTEISALCHGKRWLMSIPVRPEADSDTIICDALRALKNRVKILEAELARPSSEEAANSDTERLDFYSRRPHAVFWNVSQFDGDSGWREAVHDPGRRHKSLREAIDAAKFAARVQGEDRQ